MLACDTLATAWVPFRCDEVDAEGDGDLSAEEMRFGQRMPSGNERMVLKAVSDRVKVL